MINTSFEIYLYRRIRNFSQFSVKLNINIVLRIVLENVLRLYIIITKSNRNECLNKKSRKICDF